MKLKTYRSSRKPIIIFVGFLFLLCVVGAIKATDEQKKKELLRLRKERLRLAEEACRQKLLDKDGWVGFTPDDMMLVAFLKLNTNGTGVFISQCQTANRPVVYVLSDVSLDGWGQFHCEAKGVEGKKCYFEGGAGAFGLAVTSKYENDDRSVSFLMTPVREVKNLLRINEMISQVSSNQNNRK